MCSSIMTCFGYLFGFFFGLLLLPFHLYAKLVFPLIASPNIWKVPEKKTAHCILAPFRYFLSLIALGFLFLWNILFFIIWKDDYRNPAFITLSVVFPVVSLIGLRAHERIFKLDFLFEEDHFVDLIKSLFDSLIVDPLSLIGLLLITCTLIHIPALLKNRKRCIEEKKTLRYYIIALGFLAIARIITYPIQLILLITYIRMPSYRLNCKVEIDYLHDDIDITTRIFIRILFAWGAFFKLIFLDLIPFVLSILIWCTFYRISTVIQETKLYIERKNYSKDVVEGYKDAVLTRELSHFDWILLKNSFYVLLDIPFLILFLITSLFFWRTYFFWKDLSKSRRSGDRRMDILVHFLFGILDLLILPMLIICLLIPMHYPFYKARLMEHWQKYKESREAYPIRWSSRFYHYQVLENFILLLLDLPAFLCLVFMIVNPVRLIHTIKEMKKDNELLDNLTIVYRNFGMIFVDFFALICLIVIGCTVYRTFPLYGSIRAMRRHRKNPNDPIKPKWDKNPWFFNRRGIWHLLIFRQFLNIIIDIGTVFSFIFVCITLWRLLPLKRDYEINKRKHIFEKRSMRYLIFTQTGHLIFDLFFIIISLPAWFTWRTKSFYWHYRYATTNNKRRLYALREISLVPIDLCCFLMSIICFFSLRHKLLKEKWRETKDSYPRKRLPDSNEPNLTEWHEWEYEIKFRIAQCFLLVLLDLVLLICSLVTCCLLIRIRPFIKQFSAMKKNFKKRQFNYTPIKMKESNKPPLLTKDMSENILSFVGKIQEKVNEHAKKLEIWKSKVERNNENALKEQREKEAKEFYEKQIHEKEIEIAELRENLIKEGIETNEIEKQIQEKKDEWKKELKSKMETKIKELEENYKEEQAKKKKKKNHRIILMMTMMMMMMKKKKLLLITLPQHQVVVVVIVILILLM
ncbi:hypothetical protein M0813_27438 [Anaeramoeba flamelloides]|uniref:Uncharacterized protein n=1 Tax=Anaeramoeba flamelloides TaxID=1746091 RepID=A0ABQ8XVR8_9EUKA|nr:hypothetical protein M0813_27438 [Anaeramoeba flamelloides]